MKKLINNKFSLLPFLLLLVLITFSSCQDEIVEVTDPNEQETLVANSTLTSLMQATTARDGSFDNIIDAANCISINLPVTVIVNGLEIIIDSEEDFEIIEAIFDEFDDDDDELEIIFPITIILSDFTEITINNFEELQEFVDECAGENEEDDDIECIDFQFPITISVFNADFEVIDTITINSDQELYEFIDGLDGSVLASINFPVTMILADGSTLVVNNNQELEAAIEAAEDSCDEDDDNDFDDDDNIDISAEDLEFLLTNCTWKVDDLEVNDQDLGDQYEGYVFSFNEDGSVIATDEAGNEYQGTWELIVTDSAIKLNLQMTELTDFNNNMWILHEIEDDEEFEIEFRQGINELSFEKYECDDDGNNDNCSEQQVDTYLMECAWVAEFNGNNEFGDFRFYFEENQDLVIHNLVTDEEIVGVWQTSQPDEYVIITISQFEGDFADLNNEWKVIECDDDRIKVIDAESGDPFVVFERDCEDDNPADCTEQDVDNYLLECIWNVVNFNGSDDLIIFNFDFNEDGTVTIAGDQQTVTGMWSTTETDGGVKIELSGINAGNIQAVNGQWIVEECAEDRLALEGNNSDNFMVLERDCN